MFGGIFFCTLCETKNKRFIYFIGLYYYDMLMFLICPFIFGHRIIVLARTKKLSAEI